MVADAHSLPFEDGSLDLVFGAGIIHHLDIPIALHEIHRVLAPGGRAFFAEPLGTNPLINAYRDRTPEARTPDERPLMPADLDLCRELFSEVEFTRSGLSGIPAAFIREFPLAERLRRALDRLDRVLLNKTPVGTFAWSTWLEVQRQRASRDPPRLGCARVQLIKRRCYETETSSRSLLRPIPVMN